MKVVILAGGMGTRLAEETDLRPKPMVEIGGRPILWHIMRHYAHFGFREFVIALGYRGDDIKRFFLEYSALRSDITIDLPPPRFRPRQVPAKIGESISSIPESVPIPAGGCGVWRR